MAVWRNTGERVEIFNILSPQTWTILGNLLVTFCTWLREAEESEQSAAAVEARLAALAPNTSERVFPYPLLRSERVEQYGAAERIRVTAGAGGQPVPWQRT